MNRVQTKAQAYAQERSTKVRELVPSMTVSEELYLRSELALAFASGVNEGVDLFSDYMTATEHLR